MPKVLIVEDNDLNLKLFNDLLLIQDHTVIASKDGIGMLELVQKEWSDLILMDVQLNGVSGVDIIKELKRNSITAHIPIVAITAFAMKTDEIRISESGCDMYLSKPVSIDIFFKVLDRFIKKAQMA